MKLRTALLAIGGIGGGWRSTTGGWRGVGNFEPARW